MVNKLSLTSLIISILGVIAAPTMYGLTLGVIALMIAIFALVQIKKDPMLGGKIMAIIAIVLSLIPIFFMIIFPLIAGAYFASGVELVQGP
jgi:hypothetical protein|tara:strand:+ start:41 stop:313 length:273 start_codon:yes stop_codon:yes gene_type:complete